MRQPTDRHRIVIASSEKNRKTRNPAKLFLFSPRPPYHWWRTLTRCWWRGSGLWTRASSCPGQWHCLQGCEGHSDLISLSFQVKSTTLRSCNLCWLVSIFCFDGDLDCSQSSHWFRMHRWPLACAATRVLRRSNGDFAKMIHFYWGRFG